MLDIKMLRDNFEEVQTALAKRGKNFPLENFAEMDKQRRALVFQMDTMRARQNEVSKQIPQMKKAGEDTAAVMAEMKTLSDEVKAVTAQVAEMDEKMAAFLMEIPNTPNGLVPVGTSDADNVELRTWGTPTPLTDPLPHWEIGETLGILDPATAAKTTGARFTFYKGLGARLERALINFMLDTHSTQHGYTEVLPPYIAHRRSLLGTGQLPKFEEDLFKLEGTDYFLNPTAEVPVTNMYREDILPHDALPILHTAYAPSFRAEAGSAGRDTRGLIRQHQFNKVELVKIVKPEDSYAELEKLTADAEKILQLLGLPYRVVRLCTGDLGFCAAMTYDIEVWMPSYGRYVEISSCSNFEGFQARRAGIRFRGEDGKVQHAHTLNGSGLAVGRTTAAILENFQAVGADGAVCVRLPEVLRSYMGGLEDIC